MTYTSPKTHNPRPRKAARAAAVVCGSPGLWLHKFYSAGSSAGFAEAFGHRQDDRA